jgi:two-component system sensor histidine kinase KdpD
VNQTTAALAVLLGVLVIAAVSSRTVAVIASLIAFVAYNFFFLSPVHTFKIAKRDDAVTLIALLAVSLIGSHLSQTSRRRAAEALALARERDAAETARRHAEAKSALIASLSHDLKTPLTALTIATTNLAIPELAASERAEQKEIAQAELGRLRRLFDHVVDLASVERQAKTAEREWVQPGEIVDAAQMQAAAVLAGHPVRVDGDLEQPLVHVDPRLTSAALAHILENAATYTSAGAPIHVAVATAGNRLVIEVRDHGPGLASTDVAHVFDRFYRGAAAGAAPFGTGMGLAITRGLLAIQGGSAAASNHPDGGAVFTIEVPTPVRAVVGEVT